MREANSPIHPDDLPTLTRNHQAYLDDEECQTTNAAKLQDDAYVLGHQRASAEHCERNLNMVPHGWRIAPIDPTPAMRLAGARDCSALLQPDQAAEVYSAMLKHALAPLLVVPAPVQQAAPLYITHRPLIRNAINLLGMRRPVAPDVGLVIEGLEAMLDGMPTPAEPAGKHWIEVAQQAEQKRVPDCDRSACGDFSSGDCDHPDCPARLDRTKAALSPAAKLVGVPVDMHFLVLGMLSSYVATLAGIDFPDNDEGDHQQRLNENKRAAVNSTIAKLRALITGSSA